MKHPLRTGMMIAALVSAVAACDEHRQPLSGPGSAAPGNVSLS